MPYSPVRYADSLCQRSIVILDACTRNVEKYFSRCGIDKTAFCCPWHVLTVNSWVLLYFSFIVLFRIICLFFVSVGCDLTGLRYTKQSQFTTWSTVIQNEGPKMNSACTNVTCSHEGAIVYQDLWSQQGARSSFTKHPSIRLYGIKDEVYAVRASNRWNWISRWNMWDWRNSIN